MKAHEFIRETFDLDNRTSISELPDLPISLIVEMLNNYKEGKVKKLLIPRVSQRSELLSDFEKWLDKKGNKSYCSLPTQYVVDKYKSLNCG
jgi:hypothetical protein